MTAVVNDSGEPTGYGPPSTAADDGYQPFDEAALEAAAKILDGAAAFWKSRGQKGTVHKDAAAAIRNSVLCYNALSERFVLQTAELRAALGKLPGAPVGVRPTKENT